MFESLKHWMDAQETESKLFKHADSELIHNALASVLYHIIAVDGHETDKEKHRFEQILQKEFELSAKQTISLYRYVKTLKSDFKSDLSTVNEYLKDNSHQRMQLMMKLNQLMAVDGINNEELGIFYDAMEVLFPEVAKKIETI